MTDIYGVRVIRPNLACRLGSSSNPLPMWRRIARSDAWLRIAYCLCVAIVVSSVVRSLQ